MKQEKARILSKAIEKLPRVSLARLPTPLEYASQLSQILKGPKIYFKRDDLTDLALGGNKTRMLEFRLANAVREDANVVIAGFTVQSNHARQIAAACGKLGLKTHLVLRKTTNKENLDINGNLLLDLLAGASVKIIESTPSELEDEILNEVKKLRQQGYKTFVTGLSDRDLSAIAYVECALEFYSQLEEKKIDPDYIFLASTGATQAGLVLGLNFLNVEAQVIGINSLEWKKDVPTKATEIAGRAAIKLDIESSVNPSMIISESTYAKNGVGYGTITEECSEAIKLVLRSEGILLDPIYTGYAMASLIRRIRNGEIEPDKTVIFLHTGGIPSLFAYGDKLNIGKNLNL